MLLGGSVKTLEHIDILRDLRFDFGEVAFSNSKIRRLWRESEITNQFDSGFFLISHAPVEGPPNDVGNLWNRYLPALKDSTDTARAMGIDFLTIHLWMDRRFVKPHVIEQKKEALKDLVEHGRGNGVEISLENLSEPVADLSPILDAVPGLGLTLDVGHGQLITRINTSFQIIEELGHAIRHVHLHDNRGGSGPDDDLHLPIGEGIIDFRAIIGALVTKGYRGTVTLELKPDELEVSRKRLREVFRSLM
jgi:sugar phosphate isomerase/epimerase